MRAKTLVVAAFVGLATTIPFVILEWINTSGFKAAGFAMMIFVLLWILAVISYCFAHRIFMNLCSEARPLINPASLLLKAVLLLVCVGAWGLIVSDQMPCFRGVPNCD